MCTIVFEQSNTHTVSINAFCTTTATAEKMAKHAISMCTCCTHINCDINALASSNALKLFGSAGRREMLHTRNGPVSRE